MVLSSLMAVSSASTQSPFRFSGSTAEVAVEFEPHPRIVSFRSRGGTSVFLENSNPRLAGLRFVAYEEIGGRQREFAFDSPAVPLRAPARGFAWQSEEGAEADRLRLAVQVTVAEDEPRLDVTCRLTNLGGKSRRLALWTINSLIPEGWLVTTVSRGVEGAVWKHGRVTAFWVSGLGQPCLRLGDEAMALDLAKWPGQPSLKYGTRSNGGWLAAVSPDLQSALLVRVPYRSADTYPDEDSNVTFWVGDEGPDRRAEMEWLSAWRDVPPGETLEWSFTMECVTLPKGADSAADSLVNLVRTPQEVHPVSGPDGTWRIDAKGPLILDRFGRATKWLSGPDGKRVAAIAPWWFGAPIRNADGSALRWEKDTVVETQAVPVWSGEGREWVVRFAPSPATRADRVLLLQDGNVDAGMALLMDEGKLVALLWNGAGAVYRVTLPLENREVHEARVSYDGNTKEFALALDGKSERVVLPRDFRIAPASRLAIGSNPRLPADTGLENAGSFEGKIYEVTVE